MTIRVLQVSAEIFPLLKTGGLADVAGALPAALHAHGADVRVLLPGFAPVLDALPDSEVVAELVAPWGEKAQLRKGRLTGLSLMAYVLDAPALYVRDGGPYEDAQRRPFKDNHRRFAFLGWAGAQIASGADREWAAQVVHCHDWHAGLAAAYLALSGRRPAGVASVYTVHNLAYQGLFSQAQFSELGLPTSAFALQGLEFHGQMSFMKAGLFYANHITTVSPTYAREIQSPEQGCGLDGLLRERSDALTGILNGVDEAVWNPAQDPALPCVFDAHNTRGKALCKKDLQQAMGLQVNNKALLFGVVSRLTEQKGLHLVLEVAETLVSRGGQLMVLGSGEPELERSFVQLARSHPQSVAVQIGYDEQRAHQLFGASDVTLVPSRFEPCGLTQMYGLKYGSLPLVHRVGGLADTVVDASLEDLDSGKTNGFVFQPFTADALRAAISRAFALYARPALWRAVRQRAMQQELGWRHSAAQYLRVYKSLVSP